MPRVRAGVLLLLIAAAGTLAWASDPDLGPAAPRTDVRRELLSEFKYVAHPPQAAAPSPFLAPGAQPGLPPPSDTSDLVRMAPFTVREMVRMETLHADLVQEKTDAHTAAVMSKLGIGLHVAPVGPVAFYAATLFYIPFAVGFAISF
jgi:hypothetical protein